MMESRKEKTKVISQSIKSYNLEAQPLLSTHIAGRDIKLYRQKQSEALWHIVSEEAGGASYGLIPKGDDGAIYSFVGGSQIWIILGALPEETASVSLEAQGPSQLICNMTASVFIATTPSPPVTITIKDKNDMILQVIDVSAMPKQKWFVPILDWFYNIPAHMLWHKSPSEVPLTRRWYH
jgi:hypothetical protein